MNPQRWDEWRTAIGSNGRPLPNLIVKIVGADGKALQAGQPGELWIKGPTIFKGYYRNPTATAECITQDGFFKTGDVGYEDNDGNLFITDRIKELIKYKGYQVAPAELEATLVGHPKVADVAVCGRHVEQIASEVPVAYVVPVDGSETNESLAKDIVEWFNRQVSAHKQLRGGIVWVDQVPKSAAGKILRRQLKDIPSNPMAAVDYSQRHNSAKL